jgi:hypothetical protein
VIRSLRKGRSSAYFQHANTGHSIGAEKFECELRSGTVVVRFALRPVDGNQRDDAEYFQAHALVSVEVNDGYIIEGLSSYLKHHIQEFSAWELEVLSNGKLFSFPVTAELLPHESLKLSVQAAGV